MKPGMLYLAIAALVVLTAGLVALVAGVRNAKDGYETAAGFHARPQNASRHDLPVPSLGHGAVQLPPPRR